MSFSAPVDRPVIEVPSFMPGRECHLDGLIGDLSDTLRLALEDVFGLQASKRRSRLRQHLVYKPPPDFVGHVQLQFVIYRAEARATCSIEAAKS